MKLQYRFFGGYREWESQVIGHMSVEKSSPFASDQIRSQFPTL